MALAWLLKDERLTSVVIGASKPQQVDECVACLSNLSFDAAELESIERILADPESLCHVTRESAPRERERKGFSSFRTDSVACRRCRNPRTAAVALETIATS
jgi:hypothetical protein